jgi:hypothetical protein
VLGFELVTKGDNVFRDLVLARIIEPTSKVDESRVLSEVDVEPASYATLKRRLPAYAQPSWRQLLATVCAAHAGLGPASLVKFDVSTLYFETSAGDGFREPGFSKDRPLEPQITLGLLTDASDRGRPKQGLAGAGAPARPGDGAAVSVVVGQVEVVDLGGVPAAQLLTSLEGRSASAKVFAMPVSGCGYRHVGCGKSVSNMQLSTPRDATSCTSCSPSSNQKQA